MLTSSAEKTRTVRSVEYSYQFTNKRTGKVQTKHVKSSRPVAEWAEFEAMIARRNATVINIGPEREERYFSVSF